ncbi:MAG: site-2 protease family protein [Candidatus Hydrogenedentes bacterium]|nr:site-2 protease family protein [Candidatus Hydrogenedentota bacterium]
MLVDVVVFLLVLGVLVFFHELGHIIAAKACGIYVDRFSLGMPPRLAGVRLGETDYCVGALPFGGYVKMAGQEDAPLSDEEREAAYGQVPPERWFNEKPVWQRFIVILAGPAMNFVLAILLYGIVAAVGAKVPETEVDTRIGPVITNSPAANAPMYKAPGPGQPADFSRPPDTTGWKTGDRILTINGNRIRNIVDVAIDAVLGAGETLTVVLERPERDGTFTRYVSPVEPTQLRDTDRLARFGVAPFDTVLIEGITEGSPAARAGLQNGDIITRANGEVIDRTAFIETTEKTPEGDILTIEVDRNGQRFTQTVQPETVGRFQGIAVGIIDPEDKGLPTVLSITDDYRKSGLLRPGDVIEQVDGQPATMTLLRDLERTRPGGSIDVKVRRPRVMLGLVRNEEQFTAQLPVAPVRAIGVQLAIRRMVDHRVPVTQVLPESFRLSYQALERTVKTVVLLVQGDLSPKELGGPVMIYQITTTAAREGFWLLFSMTAFISVNLCVFNLLPLPVLDGGLLVYLLVEGVRRKPLSPKVQERMQQVGLLLIVTLFLFITINDISRWVSTSLNGS